MVICEAAIPGSSLRFPLSVLWMLLRHAYPITSAHFRHGLCYARSFQYWDESRGQSGISNLGKMDAMTRIFLILIIAAIPAFAEEQIPGETVFVTANAYPVPFENLSRPVAVFTREDIDRLPVRSIAGVLAQAVSVDMRTRSPYGMQTDISIRGAAFSQTLILVDGMRVNDSQTAHHNSDFPVQLQDVERIEVLRGSGSSIYGADAFGGIVNIITRKDPAPVRASVSGGQHGFLQGSFSAGFGRGKFRQSISVSAKRSAGFQYDRDFRNIAVSGRTGIGDCFSLVVFHGNKEFGANGFYGPAPSKEWTNQTFVAVEHSLEGSSGANVFFQGYYRTHGDRFLYDIREPALYENIHRTHAVGALARAGFRLAEALKLTLGAETGGDWIASGNLGDHAFARTSLFGELQWMPGKTVTVYPGMRFDYYSNFGAAASPSLSGSWWVLPRIRLRSSVGRAFRIPTFTELYYQDPNHQADPMLEPESAWSAEAGTDFIPAENWLASLTLFARRERNVIDWIRSSSDEKWRTSNLHNLLTSGIEIGVEHDFGSKAKLAVHYSRISVDKGSVQYMSKYVLDYARDSWAASTRFPLPFAMEYQQTLRYKRRVDGRSYWLLDGGLKRRFLRFTAAVDFTNLFDSRYREVIGVDMPGRWFVATFSWNGK
jgi:outer membrane cobalamin receptor